MKKISFLFLIYFFISIMSIANAQERKPFGQGVWDIGGAAGFGMRSRDEGYTFTLGATAGYFVLPGLEPGLTTDLTFGGKIDTEWTLLPFLRWIPYRSYSFSPYVKGTGGALFIFGDETAKVPLLGGGGGIVFGMMQNLAINLEFLVFKIMDDQYCPDGECTFYRMGVSFSFFMGGRRAAPPRRQQPESQTQGDEPGI